MKTYLIVVLLCAIIDEISMFPRTPFAYSVGNSRHTSVSSSIRIYGIGNRINDCPLTYTNMTTWHRSNILTYFRFTSDFNSLASSLSLTPCLKEKCNTAFNYRLFRSVTYTSSPHCCHGYTSGPGNRSCTTEIKRKSMLDTLDYLNATSYLSAIIDSGSHSFFRNKKRQPTVFYLDNRAMNMSSKAAASPRRLIRHHIIRDLRYTESFIDEEILESLSGMIRIRLILDGGEPVVLANCVRLGPVIDHVTTKGVLHQVSKPIPSPQHDLLGAMEQRAVLSRFHDAFNQSDILYPPKETSFTVFAPTNEAFKKVSQHLLTQILASPGRTKALVMQHTTDFSVCDVMLDDNAMPCTLIGNKLNVTRSSEAGLRIDDARVLESDIITTDGVIHIIDTVILPEQALLIPDIFESSSLITFALQEGDVISILNTKDNLTFLAPSTEALEVFFTDQRSSDIGWLHEVMNDHIIYQRFLAHDFTRADGTVYPHYHVPQPGDDDNMLKLRNAARLMKLQCARIVLKDIEAYNGNIHEINKVLVVPAQDTWTILANDPRFSIFTKLFRLAKLEDILQSMNGTVFVPTNDAYHSLPGQEFQTLLEDSDGMLEQTMRYHVAKERMCLCDVRRRGFAPAWYTFTTGQITTYLDDHNLRVRPIQDDVVLINNNEIIESDIVSSNGVINIIDGVLKPQMSPSRPQWSHNADNLQWQIVFKVK